MTTAPEMTWPDTMHKTAYRAVRTEVQRSTAGGGFVTICVCEDASWADYIALSLTFAGESTMGADHLIDVRESDR